MAVLKLLVLFLCALSVQGELANFNIQFPENIRSEIDGKIIGGSPATEGQFPHQVHLRMEASGRAALCGGSIISTRHILTAAHCLSGMTSVTVRMGSTSSSGGITMTSTNFVIHAQYNPTLLHNDIAVITLPSEITVSSTVRPIRLPRQSETGLTHENLRVTVSGWGLTADGGSVSPNLNWVELIVISNTRCASYYGSVIIASTICCQGSSSPSQSTCSGDSGGPLIIRESDGEVTQIGVVSFVSSAGCASGAPSGYARTNKFLDWISQNTGIQIRP